MKKNAIYLMWIAIKGVFGAALSFIGLLIGLPGLILQMIGEMLIGAGTKLALKEVRPDTGEDIVKEIATE